MSLIAKDPKVTAYTEYNETSLRKWLRYDTWSTELGLCLISDIDPNNSEKHNFDDLVDMVNIKPEDKPPYPLFKSVDLLSEFSIFKLEPVDDPSQYDVDKALRYLENQITRLNERDEDHPVFDDIFNRWNISERLQRRYEACHKLRECWEIFESNPEHMKEDSFAPSYFIGWAKSKNISIPWLLWAELYNLVESTVSESLAATEAPKKVTDSEKRREEGIQAAKTILTQKRSRGELKNHDEFRECMKKAFVVDYIRKNPTTYPGCADIKPKVMEGNSLSEREPTLAKDFPAFAREPEIIAKYEELIGED